MPAMPKTKETLMFQATPPKFTLGFARTLQLHCKIEKDYCQELLSVKVEKHYREPFTLYYSTELASIRRFEKEPSNNTVFPTVKGCIGCDSGASYLTLEVSNPTAEHDGAYTCIPQCNETGMDLERYPRRESAELTVEASTSPTVEDILSLRNQLDSLAKRHSETGFVDCGAYTEARPNGWANVDGHQKKSVTVEFATPYDVPPKVYVGLKRAHLVTHEFTLRFDSQARNISKDHFTIDCITWGGTPYKQFQVSWLSVPGDFKL